MAFPVKPEAALASCFRNILQDMHPILNSKSLLSFWCIDRELKSLQKRLKMIQDVLNEAEWRSQTEGSVSDWMDDLRELLYCIEDFVDDMNIERVRMEKHLATRKHQSQGHQATDHEPTIEDIQGHYTSEKKKIVKSIEDILDNKLDEVEKDAKKLKLKSQTLAGTPVASFAFRDGENIGPLVDESEVYGRQKDKDHVIELLTSANDSSKNCSVVFIVGMGGVGKTTLARFVFQDKMVKSYFDMQSWACVSDDFDFNRVVRELIEYVTKENTSNMTTAALLDRLNGMVAAKKVLFVLDDMWTVEAWEKLKAVFTPCTKGSKILVTTRNKNIGHAINDKEIYELQTLEDHYCWALFKERAFGGVVDKRLESIGKKIVERCKGVPLAVKIVGSSLRFASEEIWEKTLINKIWQSMDVAKDGIFPVLKLSYHYLPSSLKRCFQYFSIFPTDYCFEREKLVRLWIAEGLIDSREGGMLEDLGCSYYIELQRRCLIQEDDRMHDLLHSLACLVSSKLFSRSAKGRKSHTDLGSILNVSLIKEGKFDIFDEAKCFRTLLMPENCLFDEIFLESTIFTILRVLDLSSNELRELPSSVGNLKHLRYLNLSRCSNLLSLPDWICELHNLQTLDLSACHGLKGSALPDKMGNLQNLRYLCLYWMEDLPALPSSIVNLSNLLTLNLNLCRSLTCIPDNIGDLQSLQILNRTGCRSISLLPSEIGNLQHLRELRLGRSSISCLPESICNIRNLRVLDISNCTRLNSLPRNIGNLTCIEKLERFFVGREEGHGIEELKDMNKLQGELTILHVENVHSVEHALMANLKNKVLDEIHFRWRSAFLLDEGLDSINVLKDDDISDVVDTDLEARVLDALEPYPTSLEALSFLNYWGVRIPKWMSALNFPILKKLIMKGLEGIKRMVNLELPSLEWLEIESCLKLKDVSMGVPNLINLIVSACGDLTTLSISPSLGNFSSSLTSSRKELPQLMELTFSGCSSLRDIHMMMVPSLEELQIEDCKELKMIYADHMPNLRRLTLNSLPNLTLLGGLHDQGSLSSLASLKEPRISSGCEHELKLSGCSILRDICMVLAPGLEELQIEDCRELKMIYTDRMANLWSLTLKSLPNLTLLGELHSGSLSSLTSFKEPHSSSGCEHELISLAMPFDCEAHGSDDISLPKEGGEMFPNLERLDVQECPKLKFSPEGLRPLTSLESITFSCDQLEAGKEASLQNLAGQVLPLAGDDEADSTSCSLPPKLKKLAIQNCSNLAPLPIALHTFTPLQSPKIMDCPELVSFPETGPPPSLQDLIISSSNYLKYPLTGLGCHTSLPDVFIENCDQVEARPKDPPNFSFLRVSECPKLEQQIEQHTQEIKGKDWIAEILRGIKNADDPKITGVREVDVKLGPVPILRATKKEAS